MGRPLGVLSGAALTGVNIAAVVEPSASWVIKEEAAMAAMLGVIVAVAIFLPESKPFERLLRLLCVLLRHDESADKDTRL